MDPNRRNLLKTATTAAIAASVAPISISADALASPAVEIARPAALTPYTNYVWEWFVSHDGDVYFESFPTKEEAQRYAQDCGYSIIAECKQQDFDLSIDGSRLIEMINDDNLYLIGEGEGIEATSEQEADLGTMVQRAVEAWAVKHRIDLTAWTFEASKNKSVVSTDDPRTDQ